LERCFFKFIRIETGKGGVSGWSTRLEPAHMVKSLKIESEGFGKTVRL
jgi:ribosomal protein L16/L10AE